MTTNNLPLHPKFIKICSAEDCAKKSYVRGLCIMHYQRIQKLGLEPIAKRRCLIEGCNSKYVSKGYCCKHYNRLRAHGDPLHVAFVQPEGETYAEKFWSRIAVTANPAKCWEWQGYKDSFGYGRVCFNRRSTVTHRVAFYLTSGFMPKKDVLHSCDNPRCCNPAHLREGTDIENAQDKVDRGRQTRGESHPKAKLTEQQVLQIRAMCESGAKTSVVAKSFNIADTLVSAIRYRRIWKHI